MRANSGWRLRLTVIAAAAALSFSLSGAMSVSAADKDGTFMVKGAGTSQCQDFVTAFEERGAEFISYGGWIEGYLSAMNRYEDGIYDLVAWQSTELLMAALVRFCRENPEIGFHDALNRLTVTLRENAITAKSDIVVAEHGEYATVLYEETVRRIQKRLTERGLYDADITGVYDDATRDALTRFQEEKGIEPSGLPDQVTLARLLS